ncbi:MAG: sodium:calcium antiporter [Candidatus Zixiibacteriota bacterium]
MSHERPPYQIDPYLWVILFITFIISIPGMIAGMMDWHTTPIAGSLLFGMAVFGGAFILSWAAEAVQIDISESLAIAILALLAVLPEYAVDFVFTWNSATDPEQAHYAVANMTGANRLLVGLGWPLILLIYVIFRKEKEIKLDETQRVEIFYLAMATLYSFIIPLKGSLTLIDTVILVAMYLLYARRASQMESEEPELVGPVKIIANLSTTPRRIMTIAFFVYAAAVIFFVAEPFAHSLVSVGTQLGVSEFLLVQWLAPIASETPEFIIAATWAMRGNAGSALKALISSKVNHWTLLVGTIPLVFSIASGHVRSFPLDGIQVHELFLTAAQSIFAVAVLVNLRLGKLESILLVVLFAAQLIFEHIRIEIGIAYIILAMIFHIRHHRDLIPAMKMGLGFWNKKR